MTLILKTPGFFKNLDIMFQVVPGAYVSQAFDPDTGNFTVTFAANLTVAKNPAVIYLNEKLYYPSGYAVRYDGG